MNTEQRPSQPFDIRVVSGDVHNTQEYKAVEQHIETVEKQPDYWLGLDYYVAHLQQRTLESRRLHPDSDRAAEISGLLGRASFDAEQARAHDETKQSIDTLNWAYTIFAFPFLSEPVQYQTIIEYNTMQREHRETTGEPLSGIELTSQMTTTLTWLLDEANIPHTLNKTDRSILFAPLEQTMQQTARGEWFSSPFSGDHEASLAVPSLMEEWKQQNT